MLIRLVTILRAFAVLLLLNACSTSYTQLSQGDEDQDIGLGGTGMLAQHPLEDTGHDSRHDNGHDSGLGGTGIVGTITGYGSIFVNGIEIEYDHNTPLSVNGQPLKHYELQIGDRVEVLTRDGKAYTQAERINIRHEIIGRVTAVDAAQHQFMIAGQTVQLKPGSALPQVGKRVAVSAMRTHQSMVQASRVIAAGIAGTQHDLVRQGLDLPYKERAKRWLIQAYLADKQKVFRLGPESIELPPEFKTHGSRQAYIIEIRTAASLSAYQIKQLVLPRILPVGSPSPAAAKKPVKSKPKSVPYFMPRDIKRHFPKSTPGSMHRFH